MKKYHSYVSESLGLLTKNQLFAVAELRASALCPGINGATLFYSHPKEKGVFVAYLIFGLPDGAKTARYDIHIRGTCAYPYPRNGAYLRACEERILRLPEVCGNGGFAISLFYTEELDKCSLLGKTVSIFQRGNAHAMQKDALACGLILPA